MPVVLAPEAEADWLDPERRPGRAARPARPRRRGDAGRARGLGPRQRRARGRAGADRAARAAAGAVLTRLRRGPAAGPGAPSPSPCSGPAADRALLLDLPLLVKPIIATTISSSWTGTRTTVSSPSRSSGSAGESSPSLARANQSGAEIAAKIARMIASAAATGSRPRFQRATRTAKTMYRAGPEQRHHARRSRPAAAPSRRG